MPLYADMYHSYLGSSPSVSNPYSVSLPSSHYASTPISRIGLGTSSYTRTAHNFYPPSVLTSLSSYSASRYIPKLTTISETLGISRIKRAAQHRVRQASPRPMTINTSDIDVSESKYKNRPRPSCAEICQREEENFSADPSDMPERQIRGTISRNRRVVRLNTIRKAKSRSQSKERFPSDRSSSSKNRDEKDQTETSHKKESLEKEIEIKDSLSQVQSINEVKQTNDEPKSPSSWREKIPADLLKPTLKKNIPEKSPGEIFMEKFIIPNPPKSTKYQAPIQKVEEPEFVFPPVMQSSSRGRRTSITLQSLENLPTFSDYCQDISSDKIDDDLNAGALRKRASLIIDEELQLFNNLRRGSVVTCVLEKELASDEEIDSEGQKLKKPKHKVATKVDITNATITDIKEFVESIKDEIEDSEGKEKKPKINVVLEAVEEIPIIPVKLPVKRKKHKLSNDDKNIDSDDNFQLNKDSVKLRKKSVRKSVKRREHENEKRKSDIDFWACIDRSETQEFNIRAAKVWDRFARRESEEWIIDVHEAGPPLQKMKSVIKVPEDIISTAKNLNKTKISGSKSAGNLKTSNEKETSIKTGIDKCKTMNDLEQLEPNSNITEKKEDNTMQLNKKITKQLEKGLQSSQVEKTVKKPYLNKAETKSDNISLISPNILLKPQELQPLQKSEPVSDKKTLENLPNRTPPLSTLKQKIQIQKTKTEPVKQKVTIQDKPLPKKGLSFVKIDSPVEIEKLVAPAKYKTVTDLVKIDSQIAISSIIHKPDVPKVIEEPNIIPESKDETKDIKKQRRFSKDDLTLGKTDVKAKPKVFRTKTQPLEKFIGADTPQTKIDIKTDKINDVNKNEGLINNKNKIRNISTKTKPAEINDVHNDKLKERSDENKKVVFTTITNKTTVTTKNNNNKICDDGSDVVVGSSANKLKIEIGNKAKSPETGSQSIETDTQMTVRDKKIAHAINDNKLLSSIDSDSHLHTKTTKTPNKTVKIDAQDSCNTAVIKDKSSAALRKEIHSVKDKAIAMTNVKDADTTQQTTGNDNDIVVVEVCTHQENLEEVINNNNNNKNNNCNVEDESILIASSNENKNKNKNNEKDIIKVCDDNKDIDTILDASTQQNNTENALAKFPTDNNLNDLSVENDQLNDQLDNNSNLTIKDTDLSSKVLEDNCTLRNSKEPLGTPLIEDEEQNLPTKQVENTQEEKTKEKEENINQQVNKLETADSNTEETSFNSTDTAHSSSATEDWSSGESIDEEEKQRLKARENLLLLLRMARNDDTPVKPPPPQKKMILDLNTMKKCYAKEEKAVITLVAKPKPLWKYVRRNKPHKRRNQKLLEKAKELERLEKEKQQTGEASEQVEQNEASDESHSASDVNSSTKNSKSSTSSDYTEYYDFSFPYYVKDEDNNLLVNSRLSQKSVDSGIGGGSSEAPSSLKDPMETSHVYTQFTKTGKITPPATLIPRFKKYNIDDFHFLSVLGKGSFGKVFLAELKNSEYYYAVKALKKDIVLEDDDVECTLIERKVLALGTKHPFLCHLFATFQTDSHLFFVMEYLNGGDLMFHIQRSGRFSEDRARFYAAEIVSGLKFLHKKGIIYRDLKLDNILLDFEGHARIADFGMCKLEIYLDRTADSFCGTPDYMAPEIIKGQNYNQSVDWWSFGVLVYEMLIGQSPFSGCDEDELFWSICNEIPWFPAFLSKDALKFLKALLEKDATIRLGSLGAGDGDIIYHPFFNKINWDKLERREYTPPFKPEVLHPLDTKYFDNCFTKERARLTLIDRNILKSINQELFDGFTYTNPNATLTGTQNGFQHAFESGLDLKDITFLDKKIYYLVQEELQKIILDKADQEKRLSKLRKKKKKMYFDPFTGEMRTTFTEF